MNSRILFFIFIKSLVVSYAFGMTIRCPQALLKNEDDIERESKYILPNSGNIIHGHGTLHEVPDEYIQIRFEDISNTTSCRDFEQFRRASYSGYIDMAKLATCPYYFRRNIDYNRVPAVIITAKCACRCCEGAPFCSRRQPKCREVYTYSEVLRKVSSTEYRRVVEPIAVGCTCVNPVVRRSHSNLMPIA